MSKELNADQRACVEAVTGLSKLFEAYDFEITHVHQRHIDTIAWYFGMNVCDGSCQDDDEDLEAKKKAADQENALARAAQATIIGDLDGVLLHLEGVSGHPDFARCISFLRQRLA